MEKIQNTNTHNFLVVQKIFSLILVGYSSLILLISLSLWPLMSDVEFYEIILLIFNFLYLMVYIIFYSILFFLNFNAHREFKTNVTQLFLRFFKFLFVMPIFYFCIISYFGNDNKFNFFMEPRDTGIILFHLIFIVVNYKIYTISKNKN